MDELTAIIIGLGSIVLLAVGYALFIQLKCDPNPKPSKAKQKRRARV